MIRTSNSLRPFGAKPHFKSGLKAVFIKYVNDELSTLGFRGGLAADAADCGRVEASSEVESFRDRVLLDSAPTLVGAADVTIGLAFDDAVVRLSLRTLLAQFAPAGSAELSPELSVGLVGTFSCVAAAMG